MLRVVLIYVVTLFFVCLGLSFAYFLGTFPAIAFAYEGIGGLIDLWPFVLTSLLLIVAVALYAWAGWTKAQRVERKLSS